VPRCCKEGAGRRAAATRARHSKNLIDVNVRHTLEEARAELTNLGLPPLMIEGGYEDVTDASPSSGTDHTTND
jgi:hypothetical protein